MVLPVIRTYTKAVQKWGLMGTLRKMYQVGEIKFGDHIGTDVNGNKYYENTKDYWAGSHRWVEYKDLHNYDSSTVTAGWHGWLHHMRDEPPTEQFPKPPKKHSPVATQDDCIYDTHLGMKHVDEPRNPSLLRPVGYGWGNQYQKWGEPAGFYLQQGHISHHQAQQARENRLYEEFDPKDPKGERAAKRRPIRDLDEI